MDIDIWSTKDELEKENWTCAAGHYSEGKIVCIIPKLDIWDENNMLYNVDIALNGQQFSGSNLQFRFYDISINRITPEYIGSEGGTTLSIIGTGLFDSPQKWIKIQSTHG